MRSWQLIAGAPVEDFREKVARVKVQFNPDNVEISIRKLIFLARNNADDYAKQRLMSIVRDLIHARSSAGIIAGAWFDCQHHGFDGSA